MGPAGPEGAPVTPLMLDETPCVALPFAHKERAERIRAATEIVFSITDARSVRASMPALACHGRQRVVDDLSGELFTTKLVDQELVKYPPTRTLADSLLLRREHWWWMPRIVVSLAEPGREVELAPRTDPAGHAVLAADDAGLRVTTVSVQGTGTGTRLTALDGSPLRGDTGPASVVGHDFADDFERWESWVLFGRLYGSEMAIERRKGESTPGSGPLRLVERLRRHRRLAKECRDGIVRAERNR